MEPSYTGGRWYMLSALLAQRPQVTQVAGNVHGAGTKLVVPLPGYSQLLGVDDAQRKSG